MVDARQAPCLRDEIDKLWIPLWDAYRRGLARWWKKGYDHRAKAKHEPIAKRMIGLALEGNHELVRAFVETFAVNSNALHMLFNSFATVFTYDEDCRRLMSKFWPGALETALDAVGDGSSLRSERPWFGYMVAALLPTPSPHSWDPDIDGTFGHARENWIQPSTLGILAQRWVSLARWEPMAVDAVIKFGKSAPTAWQTSVAFEWIEEIVDGRYDLFANRLYYLEEWLAEFRGAGLIIGEAVDPYFRIVDGLATAGDRAAVRLQQMDE
jgi:hypothetical protein